ncbi:MAG: ribosome small subunit-dependent GTPase A [Candidatus Doudnabacteria bacterium]|nr:ribosome small subunit-dependent GTPase A [Candidatus Doudnabacteria bacterium]
MHSHSKLDKAGWQSYISGIHLESIPENVARIAIENKSNYLVFTSKGEKPAVLRGNLIKAGEFPRVGDWIEYSMIPNDDKVVIERILSRKTLIARNDGEARQEIASNVDILFIVQSLDKDFSLPRLERYLVLARESKVQPIVLINKTDLKEDHSDDISQVKAIAMDVPVLPVSAKNKTGLGKVKEFIQPGLTVAFMGSSGVGKSSLINAILGVDIQMTGEVRLSDSRGKHTTTKRELIILPSGGILLDTPGIRELGMSAGTTGLNDVFDDLDELSLNCKYSNCDHEKSQGCAILNAIETGELDPQRYHRYLKLKKEIDFIESKTSKKKELERKQSEKKQNSDLKKILKHKHRE